MSESRAVLEAELARLRTAVPTVVPAFAARRAARILELESILAAMPLEPGPIGDGVLDAMLRRIQGGDGIYAESVLARNLAFAEPFTGAVVELLPDDPEAIVVPGGEAADRLHCTVAFLGKAADYAPEIRNAMIEQVQRALHGIEPFEAQIQAPAIFGGDEAAAVGLLQGAALPAVREAVERALGQAIDRKYPIWTPHITFGYGLDIAALTPVLGKVVRFSRVAVAFGDESSTIYLETPKPSEFAERNLAFADLICPKCDGKGYIPGFDHIESGKCFMCGGSGVVEDRGVWSQPASAPRRASKPVTILGIPGFASSWGDDIEVDFGDVSMTGSDAGRIVIDGPAARAGRIQIVSVSDGVRWLLEKQGLDIRAVTSDLQSQLRLGEFAPVVRFYDTSDPTLRARVEDYLSHEPSGRHVNMADLQRALLSRGNYSKIPLMDVLRDMEREGKVRGLDQFGFDMAGTLAGSSSHSGGDCPGCGMDYADFRGGMTIEEASQGAWNSIRRGGHEINARSAGLGIMAGNKQAQWEIHKRECAGGAYARDCAAQEAAMVQANMSRWGTPFSVLEANLRFADLAVVDLDAAEAVARETPMGVSLWPKIKGYLETAAVAGAATVASLTAGLVALAVPVALATAVAAVALGQMGAAIAPLFGFDDSVLARSERFDDGDPTAQGYMKPARKSRKKAPAEVVEEVVAAVPEARPWVETISRVLLGGIVATPAIAAALTGAGVPFVLAHGIAAAATAALGMGAGLWSEDVLVRSARFAEGPMRAALHRAENAFEVAAKRFGRAQDATKRSRSQATLMEYEAADAEFQVALAAVEAARAALDASGEEREVAMPEPTARDRQGSLFAETERFSIAQRIAHLARIPAHLVDAVWTSGALAGFTLLSPVARAIDLTVTGGGSALSEAGPAGQDMTIGLIADAFESAYASLRAALGRDPSAGEFVDLAKRPSGPFSGLAAMFAEGSVLGDNLRFGGPGDPIVTSPSDTGPFTYLGKVVAVSRATLRDWMRREFPHGYTPDVFKVWPDGMVSNITYDVQVFAETKHDDKGPVPERDLRFEQSRAKDGKWGKGARKKRDADRKRKSDESIRAAGAAWSKKQDQKIKDAPRPFKPTRRSSESAEPDRFTESRTLADVVAFEAGDRYDVTEIVARVRSGDLTGALSRLNDLRFAAPLPANLAAPVAALHEQVKSEVLAANGVAATGV